MYRPVIENVMVYRIAVNSDIPESTIMGRIFTKFGIDAVVVDVPNFGRSVKASDSFLRFWHIINLYVCICRFCEGEGFENH